MLQQGDRIADWVVDAPLGEGAMGAVYRVHSALSERVEAALKVMKPSGEPDDRALFIREAEALAALRHPAIVHVMGFNEDRARGLLCLVMELAEGETLRHRLAQGAMALPEALHTFVPLAGALEHAHAHGIFHRDIKPANVILCADGPRLVDFGIAAAAHEPALDTETPMGTLAYLPPEVFRGDRAGPAAIDVYAFGLLLYEALTGLRGFAVDPAMGPAEAARVIGDRKLEQGPFDPGPRFPHPLRDTVRGATDPDAARRPPMRAVRASLESLLERRSALAVARDDKLHRRLAAEKPSDATVRVPDPPESKGGRKRLGVAVLVGLFATLVMGVLVWRSRATAVRARGTPVSAVATASARPSPPAATPTPRPAARPTVVAAIAPTPVASAASSANREDPRPRPSDAGEAAAEEPAADLSGEWTVLNRNGATDTPDSGLELGYRIRLRQEGRRIIGEGEKATENGVPLPPERRTPISLRGRIVGSKVVLDFTEGGTPHPTMGYLQWDLQASGGELRGRFTAAGSAGASLAQKVAGVPPDR